MSQQLFFSLFIYKTKMFAGGVLAGSLAIISDAAHLLTDFASFMISLLALMLATRSPSKKFSFGWYRAGKRDTCKCLCPYSQISISELGGTKENFKISKNFKISGNLRYRWLNTSRKCVSNFQLTLTMLTYPWYIVHTLISEISFTCIFKILTFNCSCILLHTCTLGMF